MDQGVFRLRCRWNRLYAPDATFIGTGSKSVVVKSDEIRKYFEQALLTNRPRGARLDSYSATVLADTVVLFTGLDTVTGVRDGAADQAEAIANMSQEAGSS